MKKPFHTVCICILASFVILVLGVFIGRNTKNEGIFISDSAKADSSQATTGMLNINTATTDQLQLIPGIGPVLAQRIVDYRAQNGLFNDTSELMNVEGIGTKIMQNIFQYVTVGGDHEDTGS